MLEGKCGVYCSSFSLVLLSKHAFSDAIANLCMDFAIFSYRISKEYYPQVEENKFKTCQWWVNDGILFVSAGISPTCV